MRRYVSFVTGLMGSFAFNLLLFLQVGVTIYSVALAALISIFCGIVSAHCGR